MIDLYTMTGPTLWAEPPNTFSYSALSRMKTCLRSDQLQRSAYGPYHRFPQRPGPALFYGNAVHKVLEALFKGLIKAGLPARRDPAFRQVIRQVNPVSILNEEIERMHRALQLHPRGHGVTLRRTASELYGEVSTLFQRQYAHAHARRDTLKPLSRHTPELPTHTSPHDALALLQKHGALSELKINHPSIPFIGTIDALALIPEGTLLADFKTGKTYPEHDDQLALYALVWWRMTGDLPAASEIVYFDHSKRLVFSAQDLEAREQTLKTQIKEIQDGLSRPHAPVSLGQHCARCSVRQFCDPYWERSEAPPDHQRARDAELTITHLRGEHGFMGLRADGTQTAVVFNPRASINRAQLQVGRRVRLLQALPNDDETLEITPWSEIFWLDTIPDNPPPKDIGDPPAWP